MSRLIDRVRVGVRTKGRVSPIVFFKVPSTCSSTSIRVEAKVGVEITNRVRNWRMCSIWVSVTPRAGADIFRLQLIMITIIRMPQPPNHDPKSDHFARKLSTKLYRRLRCSS